jgi:CRISPR-associated protein Csm1
MDETVYKIATAGFFHDIGKLVNREIMGLSQEYIDNHSVIYLPLFKGRYSHTHALYTAAFIEEMRDVLPEEFNKAGWGEGDSFINLAAGHHTPDTPMQWIIAIADRISSGWDRAEFDEEYNKAVAPHDYKKNRLLPIFENLSAESGKFAATSDDYNYCYSLKEISPENLFPKLKSEIYPKDNEIASRDYQALFAGFVEGLKGLYHREENKMLWFEHFESLTMMYASAVPAARAGHVIPDVSLYDHLKTTSAIGAALYLFHKQTESMSLSDIKNEDIKKFLIISGDFYGIQNFIFSDGDIQKNRSKMLRGRSFAVSLFSELVADMLCRRIGIPSVAIILDAAGKFTLIAPNTETTKQAISDIEKKINDWLIKISYGEMAMGISSVDASPNDFLKGRFEKVWSDLHERMDRKKFHKLDLSQYAGPVSDYLDSFQNDLEHPLCPFCGKRPSSDKAEGSRFVGDKKSSCTLCRDHIFLGENVVKNLFIAITTIDADIKGGENQKLLEPVFGEYQVSFLEGELNELANSGALLKYWDISNGSKQKSSKNITARFINCYVPLYTQEDKEHLDQLSAPKTLGDIARKSLNYKEDKYTGVEALGVLKADVDNLGLLLGCGLKGEMFTISRLATFSRQLNNYFSVFLPHLLMTEVEFNDVYTVFAGGDDLFLIGPWNRVISLSKRLRDTFSEYVCHNPEIHLSAGISIHKPNTSIGVMAEAAEKAMDAAKNTGMDRGNKVTIFSETILWDELTKLMAIQNNFEDWMQKKWINAAMLYRMNHIIKMKEDENRIVKNNEINLDDMECTKWRAMLAYTIGRNAGKEIKTEERSAVVDRVGKALNEWLSEYGSKLKIPVWNILYNRRT